MMLHPWMLLGLAGLAVPVVLHLIQRQRLRPQPLATLQFLDVEDAANAFAPVPRDLVQLLLRLLVAGLLVLLMARLALEGGRPGPRTTAVLLDQSLSMQQKIGEQETLFDRHKQQVLERIERMGPGDRMALMLVGDRVVEETDYLEEREELREIAAGFQPSEGGAQALVPAICSAARQLAARRDANPEVLVFSDHQRSHFQPYLDEGARGDSDNPALAVLRQIASSGVRVVLVDEAPPLGPNLAVEQAMCTPEQVYLGGSSRVTAVVRNHSQDLKTTKVRVVNGQQPGPPREVSLAPGEAARVDLVQRFDSPQDSACRVEIEPDSLPADDQYSLPMRVRDRKQVLLVVPPGETQGQDNGLELSHRGPDLLAYALNPGEALGQGGGTAINVRRVTPTMFGRISLPMYSVIVLYGVAELPDQSARDLEAFVQSGGGVWLVPDRDVSPLRFNEGNARLLAGCSIGQIKQPDPVETLGRDESSLGGTLLLPLLRQEWGGTGDIHFSRYHLLRSPGTGDIALRTGSGDPLAVVVRLGRGRVFVQLFDAELDSTSLARTAAFVPMVQQVAAFLGQRGEPARPDVLRVGQSRRVSLPEFRGMKGDVDVKRSHWQVKNLPHGGQASNATGDVGQVSNLPSPSHIPLSGPDNTEVQIDGLLRAGIYELSHPAKASSRTRYVAVNPVLGESEPTRLTEEEQETLFGGENVVRLPLAEAAESATSRRELLASVALLLCAALAVESLAGAWQSRRKSRQRSGGKG